MSKELDELIAKLEAEKEGSRELDKAIWLALGNSVRQITETGGHHHERWVEADGTRWALEGTRFTTSLDAALSLAPEGYGAVSASINERGPSSMRIGH